MDNLSLDDIRVLLELLAEKEVTEFKFERGEERLFLKRGSSEPAPAAPQIQQVFGVAPFGAASPALSVPAETPSAGSRAAEPAQEPAAQPAPSAAPPPPADKRKLVEVTSPMVGTFYRRPAVDAEPYVDVGDFVKKGDVLCIVEAMKLMNEIESDYSGKIAEVCLDDGQMVEYGEPLFRIEVS